MQAGGSSDGTCMRAGAMTSCQREKWHKRKPSQRTRMEELMGVLASPAGARAWAPR